jgi:hypothetical protein
MNELDYIYEFNDITNTGSAVGMTIPHTQEFHHLHVYINDSDFVYHRQCSLFPELIADFVDLAVSTCLADWLSKRKKDKPYKIRVILPVRHPEIFSGSRSLELLQAVLYWYTGDHWEFEFTPRAECGRLSERQLCIGEDVPVEVALWSGGLDALAGLYNRISKTRSENFTLFGTGSSKHIIGVQQKLANKLKSNFGSRIKLIQLPFYINGARKVHKNEKLRSRGFAFVLLGAVCASLENQEELCIYENGIGAINLPFRASEVGLDHSRSVHPLSLLMMSELASLWLGTNFKIKNPFLLQTKAQMCEVFDNDKDKHLIPQTVSCDSLTRQKGYQIQCGFCSSCLLRRQSLAVAGIEDRTKYVITHSRPSRPSDRLHFRAMQCQVETLRSIINSDRPWYYLTKEYPVILDIADRLRDSANDDHIKTNLLQLYGLYVNEWDKVRHVVGKELLDNG